MRSRLSFQQVDTLIESFIEFYQNKGLKSQRFGKGWLVLCPFHHDRNPSLGIYRDGTAYCFVCKNTYKLEAVLRAYEFWAG